MADFESTVLKKLDSLEAGQKNLAKGQERLEKRIDRLEEKTDAQYNSLKQEINQAFDRIGLVYTLQADLEKVKVVINQLSGKKVV